MELQSGVNIPGLSKDIHSLKIHKTLYGGKEVGRTWFKQLSHILISELGNTQLTYNECVFYKKCSIFFLYTGSLLNVMMNEVYTWLL
jgi:hypothetical protein